MRVVLSWCETLEAFQSNSPLLVEAGEEDVEAGTAIWRALQWLFDEQLLYFVADPSSGKQKRSSADTKLSFHTILNSQE